MTKNTGTQSLSTKPLVLTGTSVLTLALITGCSTTGDAPAESPAADQQTTSAPATSTAADDTTSSAAASDDSEDADDTTESASASPSATDDQAPAATSDDPVFDAIAAVTGEYTDGIIIEIDREDDDQNYEIEVVVGDRIIDVDVALDGTLTEDDDDDDDDDDIRKANEASVTAEDALNRAFEGRASGLTVDDAELDEEDGRLVWEIDFDDVDGNDADEVVIDAQDGSVISDSAA